MSKLKDIGKPVRLNSTADPGGRANDKFKSFMNIVDIVPVNWNMNLAGLTQQEDPDYVISYEFDKAMKKFEKDCASYGLSEYQGLRCWLTGETVFQEEISNEFSANKIETGLNALSSFGETARSLGKSMGEAGEKLSKDIRSSVNTLFDSAGSGGGQTAAAVKNLANVAMDIVMEGKHVSLPKIWHSSGYDPSLALNVNLVSPYGDQSAITEHVINPLLYLLILSAPESSDGISYGKVRYVNMKAYGISNINLAYIASVSINRGGGDITYNKWRQPLSVTVSLNIKPAATGFAMISPFSKNSKIDGGITSSIPTLGPAFTTVGTVRKSFDPVPTDIMSNPTDDSNQYASSAAQESADGKISYNKAASNVSNAIGGS
ncbi:MAG: hypothetical protein H8D97_01180 [Proteobacteria bacterium]|nr:hypothetical protein [Pseudomonadota bacterium]